MKRRLGRLILTLMVVLGVPVALVRWELTRPIHHPEVVVTIEPGTSVAGIAEELAKAGAIPYPLLFRVMVRSLGTGRLLKAGEYVFLDGLSVRDVYQKVLRGEFRAFRITLLEGWTMQQMAEYLGHQSFAPPSFTEAFLIACRDTALIARLEIPNVSTLEGYLFPDTYEIHRPKSAVDIVARLVQEFQKRWTPEMRGRAEALGLTMHQVVTLASIIEKETGATQERPLVSSVFHNRLKKGMRLESDPTVIYGLTDYDGKIHKNDLTNPHLYNTYVHEGLPPGPIANPGLASLEAALNPAATEYLYFVSRNNGTHEFATSYAEHVKNVVRYQLRQGER